MTVTPSAMKSNSFSTFIDNQTMNCDELPLVHSTRCDKIEDISKCGVLTPQHCTVFNEPLIYLFYGRPAYRSKEGNKPATDIAFCPVCFVFKPDTVTNKIARVFPFDTGASNNGFFAPHIEKKETISYELTTAIESARRVSQFFFETNQHYFIGKPKVPLNIPAAEKDVQKYYELISHEGVELYDDRRSAIEFQLRDQLILKDNLLAIVLPLAFLQQEEIRKTVLKDWRTYPITYDTVWGTMPSEYNAVVRDKLKAFLTKGQIL